MNYSFDLEVFRVKIDNDSILFYEDKKPICAYYHLSYITIIHNQDENTILLLTDKINLIIGSRWIFSIDHPVKNIYHMSRWEDECLNFDLHMANIGFYRLKINKKSSRFSQSFYPDLGSHDKGELKFELIYRKYVPC